MPIYHLRARTVSRASGASATAAAAYALRLGKYSKAGLDPCVFSHSGNMPAWAAAPASGSNIGALRMNMNAATGGFLRALNFPATGAESRPACGASSRVL